MNVMDFFKAKPAASTTVANTDPQGQGNKPADPPAKTVIETNPNSPAKSEENPLDLYAKLFQNAATASDIQAPSFSLDPKIIAEVSSKMNFTQGINPELVQNAKAGDAAAMIELIQEVGRNSYRAALEHTTKLTDTHLTQRADFDGKKLVKGVRDQLTSDALSSGSDTNINLNHPVIRAELNAKAKLLSNSPEYAEASPQEIAKAAKQMLVDIYSAVNPAPKAKSARGQGGDDSGFDYAEYILGGKR